MEWAGHQSGNVGWRLRLEEVWVCRARTQAGHFLTSCSPPCTHTGLYQKGHLSLTALSASPSRCQEACSPSAPSGISLSASVGLLGLQIQIFPKVLFFRPLLFLRFTSHRPLSPATCKKCSLTKAWNEDVGAGGLLKQEPRSQEGQKSVCGFRSLLEVPGPFEKHWKSPIDIHWQMNG